MGNELAWKVYQLMQDETTLV